MRIIIGSDVVVTDTNREFFKKGNAQELVGREIKEILDKADYRIYNLETALTEKDTRIKKCGPNISAPTACVNGYKALGADLLCLANNHVMDFCYEGLVSTMETLDNAGISFVGAGLIRNRQKNLLLLKKTAEK